MLEGDRILLGKAGEESVYLLPGQMNRHGMIAGASGTGKTVTLKVIAESLSDLGVPTFIADVKGDLTGMIVPGNAEGISGRLTDMQVSAENYCCSYPVHFFDVYGEQGHPVRAAVQNMGPLLLSRILDLSDAQEGVLSIVFKAAEEMNLDLIDLKDLQAMTAYVGEHAKDYTVKYGNVSKQSAGAIQRKLLQLEQEGAESFFGMPELNLEDWMMTEGGKGVMNILECQKLFQHPLLYSMVLFWMLSKLYENLPEVGDLDKPKLVFFFDEAHLLFDHAPKALMTRIEQTVKLIRSKGVGVFFISQSPADIPDTVMSQLSHRIQHSLRAYTPAEFKQAKIAAESFRLNPDLDAASEITSMKTGTALVSVLDEEGAPTIVQKTKILPPRSSMAMAAQDAIRNCIERDSIYGKYEKSFDPASAYEAMDGLKAEEEQKKQEEEENKKQAKLEEQRQRQEEREALKKEKEQKEWGDRLARKARNRLENEAMNIGIRSAKKFLKGLLK
ncbi:MAG: DUF853 family protein [Stecheria intestinalis]|nr:DUF853 family protein [Stecheria intestinalis]